MLISAKHQAQYQQHYKARPTKAAANAHLAQILQFAHEVGAATILDYGCGGHASIDGYCALLVQNYDPGIPAYSELPTPADLVVCLDVLEHVEADCIEEVIAHIRLLALKGIFLTISCRESPKKLPDGSPWHIFVRDEKYWREVFSDFTTLEYDEGRKQIIGRKVCSPA
jgi:hypothetical protein